MKKDKPDQLVYILTNPIMPELIKIGHTTNLKARLSTLSSNPSVPVAFECYYCCKVKDMRDAERRLHFGLGGHRVNPKREFFRFSAERAKVLLEGYSLGEVTLDGAEISTPEEKQSFVRESSRNPAFAFSMVDIKKGSTLTFLNDEEKTAIVTGNREIEFEGRRGFLSTFAQEIMNKSPLRGPDYWIFDNETLTERRIRMESGNEYENKNDNDNENENENENEMPAPEQKQNSVKGSSRSTKFSFSMVNIKNGETLTFIKDETKVATVIDAEKGKIMFDGEPGTLSGFAQSILNKKALQGSKYWKYKGEILTDLRERIEREN